MVSQFHLMVQTAVLVSLGIQFSTPEWNTVVMSTFVMLAVKKTKQNKKDKKKERKKKKMSLISY